MLNIVLFITLLLVHHTSQDLVSVPARCHSDVSLPCPYDRLHLGDFRSIIWYKLIDNSPTGIAMKKKNQDTELFEYHRLAGMTAGFSLEIPRAAPSDSGIYQCSVRANVGGTNRDVAVNLTVEECATPEPTVQLTSCDAQVQHLPIMWSIMGYLAVGLVKVTLSLICILVIRFWSRRTKRKW